MSTLIINEQQVFIGEDDFTSYLESLSLNLRKDAVGATTLGSNTNIFKAGLEGVQFSYGGFWEAEAMDDKHNSLLTSSTAKYNTPPISVAVTDGADGELAYTFRGKVFGYDNDAKIGEMFRLNAQSSASGDKVVRGYVMIPKAAYTTTANGTAAQLGAVTASQKVYAALHVFEVSGTDPTLDVIVESDDGAGFASGTTQITFTQATTATAEWMSAAGAITDDYWRVGYTIGGTDTPTFTFAVIVGIR